MKHNLLLIGTFVAVMAGLIWMGQHALAETIYRQRATVEAERTRCFECGAMYAASGHKFCDALIAACDGCYPYFNRAEDNQCA